MPKKIDLILSEALAEKGLLSKRDLESLLQETERAKDTLQQILLERGLLSEKKILDVLAEKMKIVCIDFKSITIDKSVLEKVPVKIASYYRFMPVEIKDRNLTIAVSYPLDIKTQDEIRTQLGYDIIVVLSCQEDIQEALKKYYGLAAETLDKIYSAASQDKGAGLELPHEMVEDIEKLAGDASVIKLVNQIILEGWRKRATDIHIEPYRQGVALRYRIDGILYDAHVGAEIGSFVNAITSRIKIMSNLNIVEKRLPQDGRAIVRVQEQILDLRISTIPTPFGESVVVRILPTQMLFSLGKLGLLKKDLQILEKLILKPHGIIFVTGPTGSGKTTTLYACLSRINTKDRKIITIEDPIEYEMAGITQIQVMPEIGLDFARGLRSILRHDPDVIMVGEVRDLETAEIAIRVALTGHLVFSTLHTNDAASGINRLVDIGLEPYLVASSVEAFIAQRLIRVICPDCKYQDQLAPQELNALIANDLNIKATEVKISRGKGCPNCNFTGFFGRTAIYEVLFIDDTIKDLILKKTSSGRIKKLAVSRGMRTLRQDGWQKCIMGITTPEEVMKVTAAEGVKESEAKPQVAYAEFSEEPAAPALGSDRRAYIRLDSKINLRFRVFESQADLIKRGFTPEQLSVTKDISAGGLLFVSDELIPVGAILELKIELPNGEESVECLARTVRVEEVVPQKHYNIAVCFLDITGAQRGRLNKYIEEEE
ncbi:MAG: ATPase, T2SS/T4P/T4SS family [Candidatus Omnitrophota bacterium]|nr:ATPase, T2SS/T4P/T4SS family [Candidatus Omnitrophota bacterium]